ncbi:sigma factor [Nocardia abscessus]|uniref:sigma factor n=1 Tax=Nocardia abscessus TaxID=120957 RepID=UPI00313F1D24
MAERTGEQDPLLEYRRLLFATAYRMLGTVTDAEDVLQDAWLKWNDTDRSTVRRPKAYLVGTVPGGISAHRSSTCAGR